MPKIPPPPQKKKTKTKSKNALKFSFTETLRELMSTYGMDVGLHIVYFFSLTKPTLLSNESFNGGNIQFHFAGLDFCMQNT